MLPIVNSGNLKSMQRIPYIKGVFEVAGLINPCVASSYAVCDCMSTPQSLKENMKIPEDAIASYSYSNIFF